MKVKLEQVYFEGKYIDENSGPDFSRIIFR